VERIEFTPGRSNLIVKYPGTGDATCAFVGSHMDVVRREGGREGGKGWRESLVRLVSWFCLTGQIIDHVHDIHLLVLFLPPFQTQTKVPANPETWERNPFELTREGDMLYGRGTTDCLGHVALITELLVQVRREGGREGGRNPFELTREGDMLYGRGTIYCLGHVALITELLVQVWK